MSQPPTPEPLLVPGFDAAVLANSLYYRMPCSAVGCRGAATASEAPGRMTLTRDDVVPLLGPDAEIRLPFGEGRPMSRPHDRRANQK